MHGCCASARGQHATQHGFAGAPKCSLLRAQYSPDGGYIVFMSDRDNVTGKAGAANMDMGFDLYLVRASHS